MDVYLQEFQQTGKTQFYVRAIPNASATKIVQVLDDESIKIRIAAAPEKGKANTELVQFLAKKFTVPTSFVEVISGASSRQKLVRISTF